MVLDVCFLRKITSMKKNRIFAASFLAFALLICSSTAHAQRERPYHMTIKVNPLSLLLLTGNAKVEFPMGPRISLQLGGYYGGIKTSIGSPEKGNAVRYRQGAFIPELRIYPLANQTAPNGLYIAPYFRFRKTDMGLSGSIYDPDFLGLVAGQISNRVNSYGGGAVIGYQYITYGGFVMDAYVGYSVSDARNTLTLECETCNGNEYLEDYDFKFGTGGFGIRWGVGLGYAF